MRQGEIGSLSGNNRLLRIARAAGGLTIVFVMGAAPNDMMPEQTARSAPPEIRLPEPPPSREMGFVVQHFALTYESNEDDCPDGLANMLRANFVSTLPPTERTRLLKQENAAEFTQRYRAYARGPDNTDICTHFDQFDRPPQKTVQGRTAQGLDLDGNSDGSANPGGCGHTEFTSPAGETGIDNQVWRAMGCLEKNRGKDGNPASNFQNFTSSLANGENGQVLLLRGVDSLVSDDDVEVIYANTQNPAILNPNGGFIAHASYGIGDTPGGPNVMRGRISNGVLEARAPRLQLRQIWRTGGSGRGSDLRGGRSKWDMSRVRLRLMFQPDGSAKGLLGGYQAVRDVLAPLSMGGIAAALTADWDCPSIFAAVKKMADGDRDPNTGQCTTISTAFELTAVPAFVTTVEGRGKNAVVKRD